MSDKNKVVNLYKSDIYAANHNLSTYDNCDKNCGVYKSYQDWTYKSYNHP